MAIKQKLIQFYFSFYVSRSLITEINFLILIRTLQTKHVFLFFFSVSSPQIDINKNYSDIHQYKYKYRYIHPQR